MCGHGSREEAAARGFLDLARGVSRMMPDHRMEAGFLEFNSPDIFTALGNLRRSGCVDILAIPGTLFGAAHSRQDIPAILREFARQHPEVSIRYGRELGVNPRLIEAACARVRDAASLNEAAQKKTALLVAARGASGSEAISSMQVIAARMGEFLRIPAVQCAYSGLSQPFFADAIGQLAAEGHSGIIVMPYFLSSGKLVKQIYEQTDAAASQYPETQFVKAACLGNHPLVVEGLAAKVLETLETGSRING